MKTFYLLILLFACCCQVNGQSYPFNVKVKVADTTDGKVYIRNLVEDRIDTLQFTNGKFSFKGRIEESTPYVIVSEDNIFFLFFVDPKSTVKLTLKMDSMKAVSLSGSKSQLIYEKLLDLQNENRVIMEKLQQEALNPEKNRDSVEKQVVAENEKSSKKFYQFLQDEGDSEVAAFVIYSTLASDRVGIDARWADSTSAFLTPRIRETYFGKEIKKLGDRIKALTVGYYAPDFTLADSSETKTFSLASFKGKYTLLDFWASWCGPCKQEIPSLKEAYEAYHSKGFEILSVSIDDNKYNWLNALRFYHMPWTHLIDVRKPSSLINSLYPFKSIPKTLLLDKEGKIIATDLRGKSLERKLEELLGKK